MTMTLHRPGEHSEGVLPENDPATPDIRRKLTVRLLIASIRHYETTLAEDRLMDLAYPKLARPTEPADEATEAERRAWRRLLNAADEDFDAAELSLATRIQILYDDLAPDDRRVGPGEQVPFVERAIRFEGTTYALQYDVIDYEPGSNIVAIVRDGRMFDLVDD